MSSYSQMGRPARVKFSTLDADALLLLGFTGTEALSEPFRYRLRLFAPQPLTPKEKDGLLQRPAVVVLQLPSGADRQIHGLISRIAFSGTSSDLYFYEAELAAWPAFLSLWRNSRIFQNQSVPDIVAQVFKDRNFSDFEFRLSSPGRYPPREYCVQYRETDLNFVSRLLEDEGIFYWFEHAAEKHTMVLTDSAGMLKAHPDFASAQVATRAAQEGDVITRLVQEDAVCPGEVQLRDFDYLQRLRPIESTYIEFRTGEAEDNLAWGETYDYPGSYTSRERGEWRAELKYTQEDVASIGVVSGESTCRGLHTGYRFDLENHARIPYAEKSYTVVRVQHLCTAGDYRAWESSAFDYRNEFVARAAERPFVPPRITPKPTVRGTQTAIVVGPEGEEIWTDKHGRIKVLFFWDREGKRDENSSCWVRVATPWAGRGWGAVHIPRIGQEVVVDFVEGDPDHPLIIGSVYSADNPVPYGLPDNKTQSGIKSRSSKGGSDQNFNELRFEDKAGSEEIFLHAQKDMNVVVKNDRTEQVGANEAIAIGGDQTESVGGDRTESVGGSESITIAISREQNIGISETISIGGTRSRSVGGSDILSVGAKRTISIGGNEACDVGGDRSASIGKNEMLTIAKDRKVEVAGKDELNVAKKLAIMAGEEIQISVGDASITLKKDGTIRIKGKDISIEASGKGTVKASSDLTLKGSQIKAN